MALFFDVFGANFQAEYPIFEPKTRRAFSPRLVID